MTSKPSVSPMPLPQVLKGLRPSTLARSLPYLHDAQLAAAAAAADGARPGMSGMSGTSGTQSATAASAMSSRPATEPPPAPETDPRVAAAFAEAEQGGYQQGLASGRKEAQQELARAREALTQEAADLARRRQAEVDEALAAVERALDTLRGDHARLRDQISEASAALAFEALCRLLGRREGQRDTLRQLVEVSLQRWSGAPRPTLKLAPAVLASLVGGVTDALTGDATQALLARVTATSDESLGLLDAALEDDHGGLDLGLDTQLRALHAAWQSAVADGDAGAQAKAEGPRETDA